jgi:hypothetical protein
VDLALRVSGLDLIHRRLDGVEVEIKAPHRLKRACRTPTRARTHTYAARP